MRILYSRDKKCKKVGKVHYPQINYFFKKKVEDEEAEEKAMVWYMPEYVLQSFDSPSR